MIEEEQGSTERSHNNYISSAKELRNECKIFKTLPDKLEVQVFKKNSQNFKGVHGKSLKMVEKDSVLSLKLNFRVLKFKNPRSKRIIKILKCDH